MGGLSTFGGLQLYEWLTLAGIVLGPISAVAITLVFEGRRQRRDLQVQIARTLMGTRHLPADQAYNGAINLIPIEFNDNAEVMEAWRAYIDATRFTPSEDNRAQVDEVVAARQSTLIFRILGSLKYDISESDIRSSAYASNGFIWRDRLLIDAMASWPRIAATLEKQTESLMQQPAEDGVGKAT
jgi:hypothetical protein